MTFILQKMLVPSPSADLTHKMYFISATLLLYNHILIALLTLDLFKCSCSPLPREEIQPPPPPQLSAIFMQNSPVAYVEIAANAVSQWSGTANDTDVTCY